MIELSNKISAYLSHMFGNEFLEKYKAFVEMKYPASIRMRGFAENHSSVIRDLNEQGISLEHITDFPNAYRVIDGEEIIGKTLHHLIGSYYVQSLSSMIPPIVLNPQHDEIVLDLCAAPGSKSTQIADLMNYGGTLVANEPNLNRMKALIHNLDRMNSLNIWAIREKGELLSKRYVEFFDKILVDAPCSALGVIQKKQEVSNWWSSNSVDNISSLQYKLLTSALKMLKIGGEIVYSTCTLTVEENEQIINAALKKFPVELIEFELKVKHIDGYSEINDLNFNPVLSKTKRILPWDVKSEGFFIAKLKKKDRMKTKQIIIPSHKSKRVFALSKDRIMLGHIKKLSEYFGIEIHFFENFKFIINGNDINFTNIDSIDDKSEHYMRIGTKFGIIDKNNNIKLHSHAAQIIGKMAKFNIVKLEDKNDLITYFAGGIIRIEESDEGQKLVEYNNKIIGTGVCLGDKLKSQFPRSKRTGSLSVI